MKQRFLSYLVLSSGSIYSISFAFSAAICSLIVGIETSAKNEGIFPLVILPAISTVISWCSTFAVLSSNNINEMHKGERKNLIRIGTDIMKERINTAIGISHDEKLEEDVTKGPFIREVRKCLKDFLGSD